MRSAKSYARGGERFFTDKPNNLRGDFVTKVKGDQGEFVVCQRITEKLPERGSLAEMREIVDGFPEEMQKRVNLCVICRFRKTRHCPGENPLGCPKFSLVQDSKDSGKGPRDLNSMLFGEDSSNFGGREIKAVA